MNIPNVELTGCDVLLWKEGDEVYVLYVDTKVVATVRENMLAEFIRVFPDTRTLCIINDATGQPVRIPPLAN